jgi:hypothetical protein
VTTRHERVVCAAYRVPPWVLGLEPWPGRTRRILWAVYCRLPVSVRRRLP